METNIKMCSAQGHVVGMLDRDQRTAKVNLNIFDRHAVYAKNYGSNYEPLPDRVITRQGPRNKTISHRDVPGRTSPQSSCKTRKNGHFWKSLHRLKHALIVGTYLSLVTFPSILSAPTIQNPMASSRESTEPKWLNPCGVGGLNGAASGNNQTPDTKLIDLIINQAQYVEARAKMFKEDYVRKTFNMDVQQLHNLYKDHDYDWLPSMPKKLDEPIDSENLQSLELEPTLLTVYTDLQKIAVGMEQIVWDEENEAFKSSFGQIEDGLRSLLCEIYTAIIEKDLTVQQNVTRDLMGREYRDMKNKTDINIRNWIIYRDYLNMLEYIIQVFKYFKGNLSN